MTTVAADTRTGVMVSDSQWTSGDVVGSARKVFRVGGTLAGFAGNWREITAALAWFRAGQKGKATGCPTVTALVLKGRHIYTWTPQDGFCEEASPFFAIGTGGQAARAAMFAGADCRTAVAIACKVDASSGGRVRQYRLGSA